MDSYFRHPYVSQSDLKKYTSKPFDEGNILGTLVDQLCTSEESFSESFDANAEFFKDLGYTLHTHEVSRTVHSLLSRIAKYGELNVANVERANQFENYGQGKFTPKSVLKRMQKYKEYFELLRTRATLITENDVRQAISVSKVVLEHPRTQFLKEGLTQQAHYRTGFYGLNVKCLIDYEFENRVVDLKTVYSISAVYTNFWKYRYDIQTTWYSDITKKSEVPLIVFVAPDAEYPVILELLPSTMESARFGGHEVVRIVRLRDQLHHIEKYLYGYLDLIRLFKRNKGLDDTESRDYNERQNVKI